MNIYRVGLNKQVTFRSEKELSDKQILEIAKEKAVNIAGKVVIHRSIYKEKKYYKTTHDIDFLDKYKKGNKAIFLLDFFEKYKRYVSTFTEDIAGYKQFRAMVRDKFKTGTSRYKLANGTWSIRLTVEVKDV